MSLKRVGAGLLLVGLGGAAVAQADCSCGGTRVSGRSLAALLFGKTACAAVGGERWQEFHGGSLSGGPLIDYKLGPGHPLDPSETVGNWSIVMTRADAGGYVRYDYGGGGAHEYMVCQSGAAYNFCAVGGGRNITAARLVSGQVACP